MADCMNYPDRIDDFLLSYCFKDDKEIYTNGSTLIPVFRVQQALEYYGQEIRKKAIDETMESFMNWLYENNGLSVLDIREINEIVDRLKGGNDHEQNYQGNT